MATSVRRGYTVRDAATLEINAMHSSRLARVVDAPWTWDALWSNGLRQAFTGPARGHRVGGTGCGERVLKPSEIGSCGLDGDLFSCQRGDERGCRSAERHDRCRRVVRRAEGVPGRFRAVRAGGHCRACSKREL